MPNKARIDLRSAIYNDDDAAREHLEKVLWPHGPVCPRCGVMDDRITKLAGKSTRPGVYKCKDCRKPFSVTVGTVMERSHIPLSKWVLASALFAASKKGFSAHELHRVMNVSYEAAWFLFHRLREAAGDPTETGPLGGPGKPVEIDETFVGGRAKNMHAHKRERPYALDKMAVVSLVDRDGRTKSFHVANVTGATVRDILTKHADRASHLMTDENAVYPSVGKEFAEHRTVNHRAAEYVNLGGYAHVNSAESHFALLKRGIYGTFHHLSEAHLHRYLAEFDFRASTRDMSDGERAAALLANAKGKRLLYRQPDQA